MKNKVIVSLVIPICVIFSNIRNQRGVGEGGQISKNLTNKSDWWGSLLPLISFSHSKAIFLLITTVSVLFYWIGISLILSKHKMESLKLFLFLILSTFGAIFAAQNIRDALLFSLAILTIGCFERISILHSTKTYLIPVFILILLTTFKYVTAIPICLMLIYKYLSKNFKKPTLQIFFTLIFTFFIGVSGIILDKSIAKVFSLEKSFPEQQVMYQDLASFYCWSQDKYTRNLALEGLKYGLNSFSEPQNICLMHRPNAWVYLVGPGKFGNQEFIPPLKQLTSTDAKSFRGLRSGWLKTIISDPVDYIQFKLIFATQILTVGNPFHFPTNPDEMLIGQNHNQIFKISNFIWFPLEKLSELIGYSYFFSTFFLLMVIIVGLCTKNNIWRKSFLLKLLAINIFNITILSIAYVSDEARYIFPFVFINYLLLLVTAKLNLGRLKKLKNAPYSHTN
jgi:hypothetical protein